MDPEFNPDFCFSSEYQMMEAMYAGFDLRPFEKGFFVPTPFGDSFDVITPHVAPEVLARYPLLILAGRLSMTPELFPLIRQYTEQGGTVILHSKGLGLDDPKVTSEYKDEIERFVGIKILGEYQPGFSPTLLTASNESFPEGKYEYMPVSATTAGMVAVNQEKPSYPIVTENAVGRGKALFCTPYHHLTLTGRDLLKGVKAALKAAVKPLIPVAIIGHPLYFQANKLKDGYLIALYNWDAIPWEGTVRLSAALENPQVSELFSFDQPTAAQAHGVIEFKAKVDKYQVALYRITGAPGRKVQPAGPRTRSGGHRHSAK